MISSPLIPAQAGIQQSQNMQQILLGPRFRGDERKQVARGRAEIWIDQPDSVSQG
jgi:hypothetical protein